MGDFNIKMDDELHKKFKIHSIKIGETMENIVIKLIEKEVKK